MKLRLVRDILKPERTLSKLYNGSQFLMYMVEDAVREQKIPKVTAIPYGTYDVIITFSNRFKKDLPLLLDVPGYSGVRIHAGNTEEDTEGCLIPGLSRTESGVYSSTKAMGILQSMIQFELDMGERVEMEIVKEI